MNWEPLQLRLQGDQIVVRPWQTRDSAAQDIWTHYSDPFSSLWNIPRAPTGFDDGDYMFTRSRYVWAIENRSRQVIGRISLREIDLHKRSARLGISLGAQYVSRGLGSAALHLFLDYYFGPLEFQVLMLDVAAINRRAVRCYERLGFQKLESDWRSAGNDPALRLLEDPAYRDITPFFRRGRYGTLVEFYEMSLCRSDWIRIRRALPGR